MAENQKGKFFLFRAIFDPVSVLGRHMGTLCALAAVFALVSAAFSFMAGQTFSCQFLRGLQSDCPSLGWGYLPYLILKTFLFAVFVALWYNVAFQGLKLNKKIVKSQVGAYGRNFVLLCVLAFLNTVPLISAHMLILRVPNPNWLIELSYFTVVGFGLILPLLLMRMYGLIGDLIAGNGWKNTRAIWYGTENKGLKIVLACAFLFVLSVLLILGVIRGFRLNEGLWGPFASLAGEIVFDAVCFIITALFVSFVIVMRDLALEAYSVGEKK